MHCGSNILLQKLGGLRDNFTWRGGSWGGGGHFPTPNHLLYIRAWYGYAQFALLLVWISLQLGMDIIRRGNLRTLYGTLYETSYRHTSSCSSPGCKGGVTQAKWLVQISHLVEPLYRTHSFRQEWWTLDKYPRQSHSVELKSSSSQTTFKWYHIDYKNIDIKHFHFLKSLKLFGTEVLKYLNSFLPIDKFYTQILS